MHSWLMSVVNQYISPRIFIVQNKGMLLAIIQRWLGQSTANANEFVFEERIQF